MKTKKSVWKAWACFGKKHLKGKLLYITFVEPYDHVKNDWVEVEVRPVKKSKP